MFSPARYRSEIVVRPSGDVAAPPPGGEAGNKWLWPALIVGVGALVGYEAYKGRVFGGPAKNPEHACACGGG